MKPAKENLNQSGLEELSHQQMIDTDGGLVWKAPLAWAAAQLSSNAKGIAVGGGMAAGGGGVGIALTNDE